MNRQERDLREYPGCWNVLHLDWRAGHTGVNTFETQQTALKIYAFTHVQIIQNIKINSPSHMDAFANATIMNIHYF